jgi:RNA recognition motif-containing protein
MFLSSEELREHFHAHGEIESINVKTDPNTGRSRGFAFIVFSQADSIDKVFPMLNLGNILSVLKSLSGNWRIFEG